VVSITLGQRWSLIRRIIMSHWFGAVLVALAYRTGGEIDALLGWTHSPAILWPPNAVLLAALLLVPTRVWWIYLLAVLPADRVNSWAFPWNVGLALCISNISQTLLAAWLLRLGGRAKAAPRWNDYSYIVRFVCFGVLAGPCVGACLGAATIHAFHGVPYWTAWQGWVVANALTVLTFVPLFAIAASELVDRVKPRPPWPRQSAEVCIFFSALIAVALTMFEIRWRLTDEMALLIYAPLPLLLWAALRLGTGGAVAAQFTLVIVAVHGAAHGRGPLPANAAASNVLHLQLLLIFMSLPLLFLSAILQTELIQRRALASANEDMGQLEERLTYLARVRTAGEITALVAHELNQPLSAIGVNAQAARNFLGSDPPDLAEVFGALRDIQEDDRRAGEIIRGLRGLFKEAKPLRMPLEINDVIRQVTRLVKSDSNERGIALVFELAPDLPLVSGDRIQLQQVLLNLMTNAFEAMRDVSPSDRKLLIMTRIDEAHTVEVAVRDSGTGIEASRLGHIFERFYSTNPAGLGLGLSISRSIIETHGGRISAANNVERGATFRFTLPIAAIPSHVSSDRLQA
jgi:signal transduction histidine kinase